MRKKIIIGIILAGILVAGGIYYYDFVYAAKHKDPLKSEGKIILKASDLFAMYVKAEDSANKLYLDKVISVSGTIQNIEQNEGRITLTLSSGDSTGAVVCEMDPAENNKLKSYAEGSTISVAGFCNGLLIDVQLDRCKLDEN